MNRQQNTQILAIDNTANNNTITPFTNQQPQGYYPTQPPADNGAESDVRDLLAAIGRRKWFIAGITGLMALISLLISLSMTPIYRAQATIKIDKNPVNITGMKGVNAGSPTYQEDKEFKQTQYNLLKSRALARKVIDSLDLESALLYEANKNKKKAFYAGFVDKLKAKIQSKKENASPGEGKHEAIPPAELAFLKNLKVEPAGKSQLVNIYYQDKDPKQAAAIVNNLTRSYMEMNLEGHTKQAKDAEVKLREQLVLAKQKLEESEANLVRHEKEKGIYNTGTKDSLATGDLEVINLAYSKARKELIEAKADYYQRSRSAGVSSGLSSPVVQSLKADLQRLQSKYQENLQIYKPGYPLMREIQNQIRSTKTNLNRELQRVKKSTNQDYRARYDAAVQRERQLKLELEKAKKGLLVERTRSLGHNTLQREVQTNRLLYEGLLQRLKEVGVAAKVGSNNISIIDPAFEPFRKYKPNTKLNLAVGILLGLMVGSLLAILLERKDDRIKSVNDLKKLTDLPVLGIFPNVKTRGKKGQRHAVLVTNQITTAIAEAFRSLRTNMLFATPDGVPKLLHLTSSNPGEGKSNTGINLAIVFAQAGKSVLMIDADLRKPSLHKYLKLGNQAGLSNYISGEASIAEIETETDVPGLTAITAGSYTANPADFLSSNAMLELLKQAADAYDLVIIDSPPVMGLADALVLSNRSSATLFVVASHETEKKHILGAIERLKMGYGNVIGFVLTKAREGKESGYGYDYDYGDSASWVADDNVARLEVK